jgi:serine/threonine-protein kinase
VLGRRVALKVMHAEHLRNPSMHERFRREARLASRVRHPNVVEVTELMLLPDGRPYMAMEYVAGVDLARWAEARPLTLPRLLAVATQIAAALEAAHAEGVVHRDLKPENVLVTDDDHVKLLDFGVARLTGGIDDRLTQTGQVMATPSYMSPEQATGEPVDARGDLYSLGVILWELIVGTRPFQGRSFGELVLLHATQPPQPPSLAERPRLRDPVPPALDAVVLRCLAKRPEQRFVSASELGAALAAIRPVAQRRAWPGVLAAAALFVVVAALVALWPRPRAEVVAPLPVSKLAAPAVTARRSTSALNRVSSCTFTTCPTA